jgi:hypothetical protein
MTQNKDLPLRPTTNRQARFAGPFTAGIALACLLSAPLGAEMFVASGGSASRISVFADGAAGDTAPIRTIEGSNTTLALPSLIVVDRVHDEILVPDYLTATIDVFPLLASGNVAPSRVIKGPATGLLGPSALVLDLIHDEILVLCTGDFTHGSILAFPRSAQGNVAPLRTIQGPNAGLVAAVGLAFDPVHDELFVTDELGVGKSAIRTFPRSATGNVAPLRTISGAATGVNTPYGIVLDAEHDEILVADQSGAVSTFARSANGNVPALRTLRSSTPVGEALGLDLLGSAEMVVVDGGSNALLVFPREAQGTVAATRRLVGAATLLAGPVGVAVSEPQIVLGGRFAVEGVWQTADGTVGSGQPVGITSDTSYLWFFDPTNVETVVKVLDGCGVNGQYWIFAAGLTNVFAAIKVTDLDTGATRSYTNPQGTAFLPIADTSAFASCGAPAGAAHQDVPLDSQTAAPIVTTADARKIGCSGLCVNGGRFEISGTWRTSDGEAGTATGVALTTDTGYLWFFDAANVEVVAKIVDGCSLGGHYWVFAAGLTNVEVTLTVTDTATGQFKRYRKPRNTPFAPIQDTSAFSTCP